MKKTILFMIALLVCTLSYSQSRVGYTLDEIKKEFKYGYQLEQSYTNDGELFVMTKKDHLTSFYYFNDDKICYVTFLVFESAAAINGHAEFLNNNFTIMNSKSWRHYGPYGILEVELVTSEGLMLFRYTLS
jgi:hypothetical protein